MQFQKLKGFYQQEGIDYVEVFAPVARLEAIRIFLAYASYMNFTVYQMDVKTAFLYGKVKEEIYVCQHPEFEDSQYPDHVYKLDKALYGLHQAPRAWYIYVDDIIFGSTSSVLCKEFEAVMKKKFEMSAMGKMTFFLGLQVKQDPKEVLIHQGKYQANPKASHLIAVKMIFRYLVGKSRLDRKSTTSGCQHLGDRFVSWQCKKQTTVSTSTAEAEYVAVSSCCSQVIWMQHQFLDYGLNFLDSPIYCDNDAAFQMVKNPAQHSKTKHIDIRTLFFRDCFERYRLISELVSAGLRVVRRSREGSGLLAAVVAGKHRRKGDNEIASAPSLGFEEKINAGCNSLVAAGLGKRSSRSDWQEPVWFKAVCVIKEKLIQIQSVRERADCVKQSRS
ncbi:hypothetical protein E3N88_42401 [Mikania micrantha]|uniref:Reverse transcriptase Ty1/copia-type domain-containing protein n=1 Tax=Mikania micrantha TaxID=192012 RepID=A0A5N6LHV4_9ASTR|nr:hypothetical protein E3N88_42401 [Mikania micrantha]